MLSPEQFQQLIQTITAGQVQAAPTPKGRPVLAKHLRCDVFTGKPEQWDDWAFAFKRGIRAQSAKVYEQMVAVETLPEEFDEVTDLAKELEGSSGELYDVLCQFCTGEALSIIKATEDMQGVLAWQKLHKKYNPKTMARGVRMMAEAINPPKVKELGDLETAINRWDDKVKRLQKQFGEEVGNKMKIAIFTNMLPSSIQDYVYTNVEDDTKYETLRDKVTSMVSNKIAASTGPAPMDVGRVDWGADDLYCGECEYEVDAVGAHTQCYKCGGYGHLARDCATPVEAKGKGKGKKGDSWGKGGKGGDGKGKGADGKGKGNQYWSKGAGKGQGGAGKAGGGYQGTCWKCGQVGHKAAECWVRTAAAVETEETEKEEAEVELGGVWMIGQVEAEPMKVPVRAPGFRPTTVQNRFSLLAVEEESECTVAGIHSVEQDPWTRMSGMKFNVADVRKPLAAAGKVVEAGNRVILDPDPDKCFVENIVTQERMKLRKEKGVYVFDAKYENGEVGTITLDSGAGVSVWPRTVEMEGKLLPKAKGLKMVAANGTEIKNEGQKVIKFQGRGATGAEGFTWRL